MISKKIRCQIRLLLTYKGDIREKQCMETKAYLRTLHSIPMQNAVKPKELTRKMPMGKNETKIVV